MGEGIVSKVQLKAIRANTHYILWV